MSITEIKRLCDESQIRSERRRNQRRSHYVPIALIICAALIVAAAFTLDFKGVI